MISCADMLPNISSQFFASLNPKTSFCPVSGFWVHSCKPARRWKDHSKVHFSAHCEQGHHFTLLVYDYVNSGYGRMELRLLFSCSTWGKINMAILRPILADSKKSGSTLRAADDRLPAQLPNLDTDTAKLSTSSISRGSCWLNNYVTQLTNHFCICYTTECHFDIIRELVAWSTAEG